MNSLSIVTQTRISQAKRGNERPTRIVREHNPNAAIMFEHRSDYVSDSDLLRCYEWVRQAMAGDVEKPA
ncbi:hypothetical protein VE23_04350 [Paenibacillus sp. D9]|nr:hypothetical protein VE23_04350 [Paenibacillus sp. D9]